MNTAEYHTPRSIITSSRSKGFSFIEVLISVFIFTLGIVSLITLQMHASKAINETIQSSNRSWLAHSALERIKLNISELESSLYTTTALTASANLTTFCSSPYTVCSNNTCSSAEIVTFDIHELICDRNHLLDPQISINCTAPCALGAEISVTISSDAHMNVGIDTRKEITISMRHP